MPLVGSVGADDFGAACLARLRASGVGLDRVRVDETGTTGVAFVSYRSSGERSFVFHLPETASGRFRLTEPEAALGGVDCVHLMGSSAFSPAAVEALLEVDAAAAALGVRTSFDPNLRPEMLNRPEYVAALRRILGRAWLVLASEGELPALLGDGTDARCAARLLAGGAELVVVKRGAAVDEVDRPVPATASAARSSRCTWGAWTRRRPCATRTSRARWRSPGGGRCRATGRSPSCRPPSDR